MTVEQRFATPDVRGLADGAARRVLMTVSCRDTDRLPKVSDAGQVQVRDGQAVQVMHNGLLIEEGCYYGEWTTEIIRCLAGHHEPQEEVVFDAVVSRLASLDIDRPTIIELGSFWAYYSLWFCHVLNGARAIAMEPDPTWLDVGRRNARLNGLADRFQFLQGAVGAEPGEPMPFRTESTHEDVSVVQHDLASLMSAYGLSGVDLVMVDIQGAETVLLERARPILTAGNVRFLIVSTHHQSISGDPLTHQRALDLLRDCGAHIIAEHTVRESYSGDGLIAATFDPGQRDLTVSVSHARARESLYGEPEYELAALDRKVARLEGSLARSEARLAGVYRTKIWRWTRLPRAAYRSVRQRLRR